MATREALAAWYDKQLGVVETGGPHGNDGNIVAYWDLIHHHEEQGCPWCDAFVEAGEMALGVPVIVDSQYCPTVENAYRKAARLTTPDKAQLCDQVLFHFPGEPNCANHTGPLKSVDLVNKTVTCWEGNTSPGLHGSQSNGGGVYLRTRPWSQVRAVGQPVFDPSTPGGAVTSTGFPFLGAFCVGPYVRLAQTMLVNKAGQHEVVVNDHFDAATVQATENFQKMAGLDPDGKWGAATWAKMLALGASK